VLRGLTELKVDSRAGWTLSASVQNFGEHQENARLKTMGKNPLLEPLYTGSHANCCPKK